MKKFLYLTISVLSLSLCVFFSSCGETLDVAGKHFEDEHGIYFIDFDLNSNRVFKVNVHSGRYGIDTPENKIGTYAVEKKEVVLNFDDGELRFYKHGNYLHYSYLGGGSSYVETGASNFFTNVFADTTQDINGTKVAFSENEAFTENVRLEYSFNQETAKYEIEGYKPTYDRDKFKSNVFNSLLQKSLNILNISASTLTYEKAWLLRNKSNYVDDYLAGIWAQNYFKDEYDKAGGDDFARHKVIEKAKQSLLEKFNSVDKNETFLLTRDATVGKYDFDRKAFFVEFAPESSYSRRLMATGLEVPEMHSTLIGENKSILPNIVESSKFAAERAKLWLTMDEDKAEEFNKNNKADSKYLAIIIIEPTGGYYEFNEGTINPKTLRRIQVKYAPDFNIVSMQLLDSNMKLVGDVVIR